MSTPMLALKVKYSGMPALIARGKGVAKRELRNLLTEAYSHIGRTWHRDIRPTHFTNRASAIYNYAARQGEAGNPDPKGFERSYTGRKLHIAKHTRPLEMTGQSRMQTAARAIITATSKSVRVGMEGGSLTWPHPSGRVNMAAELRRLSTDDQTTLSREFDRFLAGGLRKLRRHVVRKNTV